MYVGACDMIVVYVCVEYCLIFLMAVNVFVCDYVLCAIINSTVCTHTLHYL